MEALFQCERDASCVNDMRGGMLERRKYFIATIEAAAELVPVMPANEVRALLRRAALRLRNAEDMLFDDDIEDALQALASNMGKDRKTVIRRILLEGLGTMGYLPANDIKENGGT